jgi:hypothetical protein
MNDDFDDLPGESGDFIDGAFFSGGPHNPQALLIVSRVVLAVKFSGLWIGGFFGNFSFFCSFLAA